MEESRLQQKGLRPEIRILLILVMILVLASPLYFCMVHLFVSVDSAMPSREVVLKSAVNAVLASAPQAPSPLRIKDISAATTVKHVPLPAQVRGFYWTAYTAGTEKGAALTEYALRYGLNTVVIDIKMDDGQLAFSPKDSDLMPYASKEPPIADLDALLKKLGDKGIYRIARIFVMRDETFGVMHPEAALRDGKGNVWRDKTGSAWVDPSSPRVADFAVAQAEEAYARGFDEVQFDYVRFPTDGKISNIRYPVYDGKKTKSEVMGEFFKRVSDPLREKGIPVSYDLFGMVYLRDDMAEIGQSLPIIFPLSDFISPMVYPSHYPDGFQGFANPADHPYEVVKYSLDEGVRILKNNSSSTLDTQVVRYKSRPWIQDFDIGANYDSSKIEAQIKAAKDAGASGWLLWNARNVYTVSRYE